MFVYKRIVLNISSICILNHISGVIFASTIEHNLENLRRQRKLPYISMFSLFHCSFFLPGIPSYLQSPFPFPVKKFLYLVIRVGLVTTHSLSFLSSENIFISPSFLKDIFTGCKIQGWHLFSFSLLSSGICHWW